MYSNLIGLALATCHFRGTAVASATSKTMTETRIAWRKGLKSAQSHPIRTSLVPTGENNGTSRADDS
jgi:hypothetical protein